MNKLALYLFLLLLPANVLAADTSYTPLDVLTGTQKEYYLRVFNQVVETHKSDKPYKWRSGSAYGNISISDEYVSKSKSLCRNFAEGFVIDGNRGQDQGVVCKRDDNKGWCRLTYNDARTCALETPEDMTDKVMRETDGMIDEGEEMIRNTKDWWNR